MRHFSKTGFQWDVYHLSLSLYSHVLHESMLYLKFVHRPYTVDAKLSDAIVSLLTLPNMFPYCSIIVTTVQYLSSALHKNFTETDFDFKVGAPKIYHCLCNKSRKPKLTVFVSLKTTILSCIQFCRSGI